jgi:uncharacterized OB-fold protein
MVRNATNVVFFDFHRVHTAHTAHCTRCLATNFESKELSGNCTLITFIKVDTALAAFNEQAPYTLGLGEFVDGPKVFGWVDKRISEDNIVVGTKLKLKMSKLPNGSLSYTFTKPERS